MRLQYPEQTGAGVEFGGVSYTYLDPRAPGGRSTAAGPMPTSPG